MKKYDCSKTLDYFHERNRLCKTKLNCCVCELDSCVASVVSQKDIDTLQKWSDEHPEKTRTEALLERIPNSSLIEGKPCTCWGFLTGSYHCVNKNKSCTDCWNEPYKGEFEEEEK